MNEQIRLLQAEIRDDLQAIDQAYKALDSVSRRVAEPEGGIVVGYHLHVLYGLFENLFARIATTFGNRITDKTKWHAQLLRRMTLDVQAVRPHVIGKQTYECLDELRRFRHLFRNAYVLRFDPKRLTIVLGHAERLERLYRPEIEDFLAFLDGMAGQEDGC
jgi:hypothetical protein